MDGMVGGVLAIVPARGGSQSIPRKNVRRLAGLPLIAYSIEAGLQARSVDRVIVSTDDEEIASVARASGAEVPFMRPAELAGHHTTDLPVFQHALLWLDTHEQFRPEIVVHLRPTSPVRPPDCVDAAVARLRADAHADSVRGVVPSGQNPYKMWRIGRDHVMTPLLSVDDHPEPYNLPRQVLPPTFWQSGHVDAIRARTILDRGSMTGDRIVGLEIDPVYACDLDTEADWRRAEWLLDTLDVLRVQPRSRRVFPARPALVVFDFDGVFTDNRVWVSDEGREWVACTRSDGIGLAKLRDLGVPMRVLSTEPNPVVAHRCRKLGIDCDHGVGDKARRLLEIIGELGISADDVVYVGNDTNDLECLALVGCAVVPSDAHPAVRPHADLVLRAAGGHGAVRELCDRLHLHLTATSVAAERTRS